MKDDLKRYLNCPLEEPIDERRYERHATFVSTDLLTERLSPQGYRPEILVARRDLATRHKCQPLQSLCKIKVRQGTTPIYGETGPICLKPQHIRPVLVESVVESRVDQRFAVEKSKSAVGAETVLINRSGAITLGRSAVYLGMSKVFISEHVFSCCPKDSVDAAFIAAYLNTWWGKRSLEAGIAGSTGQLQLPQSHVATLPIPKIDLSVQKVIGNKIRKADRLRSMAIAQRSLAARRVEHWFGSVTIAEQGSYGWLNAKKLSARRADGWYHQPKYVKLGEELEPRQDLVPTRELCQLAKSTVNWNDWPSSAFDYFEIGGIDGQPGSVTSLKVLVKDAPSRAKFLVEPWDLLVSTVRPNLKNLALVPETVSSAVCSSGFSVLRSASPEVAGFLWACLSHDLATSQLMRWNAGGTYPAIERTVPLEVLIPNPGADAIVETGQMIVEAIRWDAEVQSLLNNVKSDVEGLIAGTLDEASLTVQGAALANWLDAN